MGKLFRQEPTSNIVMNFILIPYLLATNLISNDDAWNNGPEYSFSVHLSIISTMENDKGRYLGKALLINLKCRPREPDNLFCHFEDAKIGKFSSKKFDRVGALPARNISYEPFKFSGKNFEIIFDQNGINAYVLENDDKLMSQVLIDMFRTIINQLNIGTNLDGKKDNFQDEQYFSMGKCPADYKILRIKTNHCEKKQFDLVPLIDLILNKDEVIKINRKIVLDKCVPPDIYYFIGNDIHNSIFENTTYRLISSDSNMRFSKNCFISETLNFVDIYDQDRTKIGSVLDHLYISLDSIHPAQGSLKSLRNPMSIDVIVKTRSNYNTTLINLP